MREAGMFRRLIGEIGEAKLPDTSQPLKLRRVDQRYQQLPIGRAIADTNNVMNRIAIDPFSSVFAHFDQTAGVNTNFNSRMKKTTLQNSLVI